MMNSTELIVGHFEGVLTPAEASQLDELLRTSPEVRAAFEQQRAIEEGMLEDSETLVPPIGLREATLAVALGGALTTTIGGGIAAWLSTKAAVVLSTMALGGVIVGGIVLSNDDAGEDTETVVAPSQMESVESVDPVGELVTEDESTSDQAEVPATASSSAARSDESPGRTTPSPREPRATASSSTASVPRTDGPEEDEPYDPFGDQNPADVETTITVKPE